MSLRALMELRVGASGALVIPAGAALGETRAELLWAWRSARAECHAAYQAWRHSPRKIEYAVYRAAADRADAAQDALAASSR